MSWLAIAGSDSQRCSEQQHLACAYRKHWHLAHGDDLFSRDCQSTDLSVTLTATDVDCNCSSVTRKIFLTLR